MQPMITGSHVLLYSTNAEADRLFFRDVLQFEGVDAGDGWLIFALPPAEIAVNPLDPAAGGRHTGHEMPTELHFMCTDLHEVIASLERKHVRCGPVSIERWGVKTTVQLPSGGRIGLYQPSHPTAFRPPRG